MALAAMLTVAFLPAEYATVASPMLAMFLIGTWFLSTLWNRDGIAPVFELGTLWCAATVVYGVFPLLNFMAGGLRWLAVSDGRLQAYGYLTTPAFVASFGWRYVVYMLSFVLVYLSLRGRGAATRPLHRPETYVPLVSILLLAAGSLYLAVVQLYFGIDLDPSYLTRGSVPSTASAMPHLVAQITHNVKATILIFKQIVLLVLLLHWRERAWRWALIGWVTYEVLTVALRLGARGNAVLLVLTAILLYHRVVRPLTLRAAALAGGVLLGGFLFIGIVRQTGTFAGGLSIRQSFVNTNEFQALFATAVDLHVRRAQGLLPTVPWQVYVSDLYLMIPSQLLPFYKWDPSEWYLEVIGMRGKGIGYMFGVMAQAAIGFDWVDLVIRGSLVGLLFALFHRWYVRRSSSFWLTFIYAYVAVWSFYTFRATTFWFVYFVVYQLIPVIVVIRLIALSLRRVRGRSANPVSP